MSSNNAKVGIKTRNSNVEEEIGNLLVSYGNVYFANGFNPVHITDEERKFYEILTKAYKYQNQQSAEIQTFRNYLKNTISSILQNFENTIVNNIADSKNSNVLTKRWKSIEKQLITLQENMDVYDFSHITLIGLSLFFMMRTSKRCLFIYLNQVNGKTTKADMYKALCDVLTYISSFLRNFIDVDIQSNMQATYAICEKLSQLFVRFAHYSENDEELESITNRLKKGIQFIDHIQEVSKTIQPIVSNKDMTFNIQKISNTGEDEQINIPYQHMVNLCNYILSFKDRDNKDIQKNDQHNLGNFFQSTHAYTQLLLLYETLSGAVRIIAKVRRMSETSSKTGGCSKRKSKLQSSVMLQLQNLVHITKQKRKQWIGGNVQDYGIGTLYNVDLNPKDKRLVVFKNIPRRVMTTYFPKTRYQFTNDKEGVIDDLNNISFGPFYSVHDSNDQLQDILENAVNINSIIQQFNSAAKSTSIVLYTYGYSGSGKTVTLFGKEADNKGPSIPGIVWEMFARIQNAGFTVSLDQTKKVYGKLQMVPQGKVIFHNDEQAPSILRIKDNLEQWKNTIKEDLQVRIDSSNQLVEEDSFTKPTINNNDSSRGFYIMRFAVWDKKGGIINERNPHYLGVVDMAGNEDPYDILSTMMPTVRLSSMNNILDGNKIETRLNSDIVYNKLLTVLPSIMQQIIKDVMSTMGTQNFNFNFGARLGSRVTPNYFKTFKYLKNFGLNALANNKHFLLSSDITCRVVQNNNKEYTKYIISKDEPLQEDIPANKMVNKSKVKVASESNEIFEERCYIIYNNKTSDFALYFNIREDFIKEILEAHVNTDDKPLSFSQIREQLTLIKDPTTMVNSNLIETSILNYVVNNPSLISIKKKWFCITFNNMRSMMTKEKWPDVKKKIQNELISFFTSQPYMIKTKDYDNENSFSSISSILAEGFFINQANAELINLFRQKKNGKFQHYINHETADKISTFEFDKTFSIKQYDKFAKILGEGELESTTVTLTKLVPTLTEMFGTDAKDIMFACLKDEKEVTQAKGAIDTLYLVQDIKST
jgi:hypothetical protein